MAQIMQKSVVSLASAPVAQRRPTAQRSGRVVALAQPFVGRVRAAPKPASLQIASAIALRDVDTVQKLENSTEDVAINAIRFLAIDGVNAANSGHPGLPMGCVSRIGFDRNGAMHAGSGWRLTIVRRVNCSESWNLRI